MYEQTILHRALQQLEMSTGFQASLVSYTSELDKDRPDALLKLEKDGNQQPFIVEVKRNLNASTASMAIEKYETNEFPALLITEYVNPVLAEKLKKQQNNFLDANGNAYINQPPLFIYINNNKPEKLPTSVKASTAFRPTGLKLLFTLLCEPRLLNQTYREINRITQVSLGTITKVIADLEVQNYLLVSNDGTRLFNKKRKRTLVEHWVSHYIESLRPKLLMGHYKTLQENWQNTIKPEAFKACWSGEVAADHLTHYLKPTLTTVYICGLPNKFILLNSLKNSDMANANVEILEKFWHFENETSSSLAPALLIYADLIASSDPRNIETAKMIYEKFLD